MLGPNGKVFNDVEAIKEEAVQFFEKIYTYKHANVDVLSVDKL